MYLFEINETNEINKITAHLFRDDFEKYGYATEA